MFWWFLFKTDSIYSLTEQNAINWYLDIYSKIQSLASLPLRCPLAPENDFFQAEIRHLLIHNYQIIYTVPVDTVYILHARHGHQKWLIINKTA
jgi:plasmid stabilization system protein ParE